MNRCPKFSYAIFSIALCALLTGSIATFSSQARAQAEMQTMHRNFPKAALRGELVVTAPPAIQLDGQADRLSPGARIHGAQNMLVMSGALVGQDLTVNYLRDAAGLVSEVWILNPEEARERRAGAQPARNFLFSSEVNTTPRDDGKTPFNQLPVYPQQ
ncbi:hypothetical protein B0E49_18550 [Polaromonas sp. C04]|nr:hypothetical protein B0E49_18550 [Polaromonas sp. C04]